MVPLPDPGSNAHLVHPQALYRDELLLLIEELGLHRRVGHEDARLSQRRLQVTIDAIAQGNIQHDHGKRDCDATAEKEDDLDVAGEPRRSQCNEDQHIPDTDASATGYGRGHMSTGFPATWRRN